MQPDTTAEWTYNDFLAFVLIYAAEMNGTLTMDELAYIMHKTGTKDITAIKARIDSMTDAEAIELIDNYKKKHLAQEGMVVKARRDLEALLNTPGEHSQLERVAVHILEKLL